MPNHPHTGCLQQQTGLQTVDGQPIKVWELVYTSDDAMASSWARHLRHHYCNDDEIDSLRQGTPHSRADYLTNLVFPSNSGWGPRVKAGDFAEILVGDYLEDKEGFWVPRTRYRCKITRDESPRGSDILAIKYSVTAEPSVSDVLAIYVA